MPNAPIKPENAGHLALLTTFAPQDGRPRGIAWSPDGRILAAGSANIHLWDILTGRQRGVWKGHTDQIHWLSWSEVTGLLASASADGTARIWNPGEGSTVHLLPNPSRAPILSVDWSPDGTRLVTGTWQGTVELWDSHTGQHLATWAGPPEQPFHGHNPYAVWGVAWAPDGRSVVSTRYDMHVLVWNAATGRLLAALTPDSQPNGVAWMPDGSGFASSDDAGTIQIWSSSANYANASTLQAHENAGWTYPLAWTHDGTLLACATDAGFVQLWDMRTNTELTPLQAHETSIWGLAWSRDGLRLATASDDETVRLWGVR